MPTLRPFCYNPSQAPISGMEQVGDLAVGIGNFDIDPTKEYWNGPNEDVGYIIAYVDPTGDHKNGPERVLGTNFICHIGFKRSVTKTESDFVKLAKKVLNTDAIAGGDDAKIQLNNAGYWTSWGVASLGTSPEMAAVSAVELLQSGVTTDGWYYIQTSSMANPRLVYCNMTDEGGGWMLMNYNPDLSVNYGNPYPNEWIGGEGTFDETTTWDFIVQFAGTASNNLAGGPTGSPLQVYNSFFYSPTASFSGKMMSINAMDIWYHNGTAQCSQVMRMASPTSSSIPLLSNMEIANKISYTNPNNLLLTSTFSVRKLVDAFTFSNGWGTYSYPTYNNQRIDKIWRESLTPLVVNKTSMIGTWSVVKGHTKMSDRLVTAPGDWIVQTNVLWSVSDSYYYQDGQPDPAGGAQDQTEYTTHHLAGNSLGASGMTRWYIIGSSSLPAHAATSSIWGMADVYHGPTGYTFSVSYNPATSSNNHFNNSGNVTSFASSPLQPETATMSSKRNDLRTYAVYIR